jgi:hypothetical protein
VTPEEDDAMAGYRRPGPQCQADDPVDLDDGTLSRTAMPTPGLVPFSPAKDICLTPEDDENRADHGSPAPAARPRVLEAAALPESRERQLLVGVIYGEAGSKAWSGEENPDEMEAIGWTFVNMAYYASPRHRPAAVRRSFNTSLGDGSLLSAIRQNARAYGRVDARGNKLDARRWHDVMNGDALKSAEELKKSLDDPLKLEHFWCSLEAANRIDPAANEPHALPLLGNRVPIAFNQAPNAPPNVYREERLGRLGAHTFYGFKPGREYE